MKYDVTNYQIKMAELCHPLTIALLSDIHNRPFDWVVKEVSARHPDLIAVTGDFVDGYGINHSSEHNLETEEKPVLDTETNILPFFKACSSIAPTFVSLGNHEGHLQSSDYTRLRATGATLLDNEMTVFDENVVIGGLTSATVMERRYWYERFGIAALTEDQKREMREYRRERQYHRLDYDFIHRFGETVAPVKILLAHEPHYWEPYLSQYDILCCSGHCHGGQARLFNRGLYAPGQGLFPRYTSGVHKAGSSALVISRGLSNTVKIPRINNRVEIVFINIIPYS